ncbi:MAG: PAS domain-containing protein [Terricaulis sp.]
MKDAATTRPKPSLPPAPDAERWLEALPAPVLGIDAGERIRFVNAAAADLLAGVGRGLLGRRLDEIFGPTRRSSAWRAARSPVKRASLKPMWR